MVALIRVFQFNVRVYVFIGFLYIFRENFCEAGGIGDEFQKIIWVLQGISEGLEEEFFVVKLKYSDGIQVLLEGYRVGG